MNTSRRQRKSTLHAIIRSESTVNLGYKEHKNIIYDYESESCEGIVIGICDIIWIINWLLLYDLQYISINALRDGIELRDTNNLKIQIKPLSLMDV